MTENSEKIENDKVYWHSRRGMLELDLALAPFAKEVYPSLDEENKALYRKLLESEDTELFAWVLQRSEPADEGLVKIMGQVLDYVKRPKAD